MTTTPLGDETRRSLAVRSLEGLSVGDAFGQSFFHPDAVERIERRALPPAPWTFTDDTVMAMSVVDVLSDAGTIDPHFLAEFFGARYQQAPDRGYGGTVHGVLRRIAAGDYWERVSRAAFGGAGSMGNGAAMRAAPIGAYCSDDLDLTVSRACQSAVVTHAHPEGQAGAIAVAVATAWVARGGSRPAELFETVLAHTPRGATWQGVRRATDLPLGCDVRTAAAALGNGLRLISEDTVPFTLWCAARHLGQFEDAMWTAVSGLGDRDTTCAIVGGILGATAAAPPAWIAAREPLDTVSRAGLGPRFRAIDSEERRAQVQRLGKAMSDLQQKCFCASWMCVTPEIEGLCRMAIRTGEPQGWGGGELSVTAAREMWALAEQLGGWAESGDLEDGRDYYLGHPFLPLDSQGLCGRWDGCEPEDL